MFKSFSKRCAEERTLDEDVPVEMARKRDIRAFLKNLKKGLVTDLVNLRVRN